jgi:hypothetical protein
MSAQSPLPVHLADLARAIREHHPVRGRRSRDHFEGEPVLIKPCPDTQRLCLLVKIRSIKGLPKQGWHHFALDELTDIGILPETFVPHQYPAWLKDQLSPFGTSDPGLWERGRWE